MIFTGRLSVRVLAVVALVSGVAPLATSAVAGGATQAARQVWVGRAESVGRQGITRAAPASGIVPPANPKSNVYPPVPNFLDVCQGGGTIDLSTSCLTSVVEAIDHAQSTEPTGPTELSISGFQHLTQAEELFAISDLERVAHGLPPAEDLTAQLDQIAQTGADDDMDPDLGSAAPPGGGYYEGWGANWAGGTYNTLASDYFWMYDDGYPSANQDCQTPNASGCWGHRDNILGNFIQAGACAAPPTLVMGAAATATPTGAFAPSFADIVAGECSSSISGVVFTWAQVQQALATAPPSIQVVGMAPTHDGQGYWIASATGRVWNYGDAANLGELSGRLSAPIVAIAADPATGGFWLVASDGGVFGFGAKYYGSEGGMRLTKPIVGIASTWDGRGYWLVAADGGLFAFGDARYHGSEGGKHLNRPIVGMAADPHTGGYWLVASDGGIFAFDAPFFGSEGNHHLNRPIVGMSVAGKGTGYRFVASDGGIFSFRAPFFGSEGGSHINAAITGMATDSSTEGYWLVAVDGGLFAFHADFPRVAGMSGRRSFRLERHTSVAGSPPQRSLVGPGVLAALFALLLSLVGASAHIDAVAPRGMTPQTPLIVHRAKPKPPAHPPAATVHHRGALPVR